MNITKNIICILFFMTVGLLQAQTNNPPNVSATGRQAYCPLSQINIVTDFTITDVDDTEIDVFYVQISSGYNAATDTLELLGNHPTIATSWNAIEGKLTFTGVGGNLMTYTALELAIENVVFSSTDATISNERFFSFTIDQANYLPSTGHFYEFVSEVGITWTDAKNAAENRTYFGLQGYLATIMSQEEAAIVGEQTTGAGWIGGTDEEEESVWKWVTGPEAGTVFWNGYANGSTPNFAFWNTGEPNNYLDRDEDYAHITARGAGITGSWNDLTLTGDASGDWQPKGYIVEYGGMPGDPNVSISASTSIYIPTITSITEGEVCDSGMVNLSATPSEGTIVWYDSLTSTTPLFTGTNFTTPNINSTTTYYAAVSVNGCTTYSRRGIVATVRTIPTITSVTNDIICTSGSATVSATTDVGDIVWYDSLTSTTPLFTGTSYNVNILRNTTFYVGAINNGCPSATREPVTVTIDPTVPSFTTEFNTTLCLDQGSVELVPQNAQGNYTYSWYDRDDNLLATAPTYTTTTIGLYKVKATSIAGCESLFQFIDVTASELSTFDKDDIIVNDFAEENYIEVILGPGLGIGDYEFALDDINGSYQTDIRFTNLSIGVHNLYIRDRNGCGTFTYQFSVLNYPRFFTPNNDGENDFWNLKGFDTSFYTASDIFIYNRYGKLITKFDSASLGWDGTFGGRALPSGGYWFSVLLTDINGFQIERNGSFSLLRK